MVQVSGILNCHTDKYLRIVHLFFFQAEDGIRDLVRSRGLGDVYKRQVLISMFYFLKDGHIWKKSLIKLSPLPDKNDNKIIDRLKKSVNGIMLGYLFIGFAQGFLCLLYTSDAADERSSVDLGGRRIFKKKRQQRL